MDSSHPFQEALEPLLTAPASRFFTAAFNLCLTLGVSACPGQSFVFLAQAPAVVAAPATDVPVTVPSDVDMPPPVAPGQALTLAQAVALAAGGNLQIQQSAAQIGSARANLSSQRAPLNPTLNYASLNNLVAPTNGFGSLNNYSAYVTLETNGAGRYRTNQARAQLQGAEADAGATRLTVAQAVADAYSDLQVANAALQNERDVYELTQRLADLTQKQFDLGAAPEATAIRAGIALTQEQQSLIASASLVRLARAALNVQLGREPDMPVDAAQPLGYNAVVRPQRARLLAQAVETRPEIRSAGAAVSAAQANVGLQKSQYFPNLTLGRQLDVGPVAVGLILPLDLGSIRGAVSKAQQDVKIQQSQAAQVRLAAAQDVEDGYLNLTQAQRAVALYQRGILPQSESLLRRVTQGYGLGASTILDVIDAQQTYRSTRNSYYTAIGTYNHAVDQLNRAVGAPVATPALGTAFVPALPAAAPYDLNSLTPANGPAPGVPETPPAPTPNR